MSIMDMSLELGSLEERLETVRSSTYIDTLHKFNSLNFLNSLIAKIAANITPCTCQTESVFTRHYSAIDGDGEIAADAEVDPLAEVAAGSAADGPDG